MFYLKFGKNGFLRNNKNGKLFLIVVYILIIRLNALVSHVQY